MERRTPFHHHHHYQQQNPRYAPLPPPPQRFSDDPDLYHHHHHQRLPLPPPPPQHLRPPPPPPPQQIHRPQIRHPHPHPGFHFSVEENPRKQHPFHNSSQRPTRFPDRSPIFHPHHHQPPPPPPPPPSRHRPQYPEHQPHLRDPQLDLLPEWDPPPPPPRVHQDDRPILIRSPPLDLDHHHRHHARRDFDDRPYEIIELDDRFDDADNNQDLQLIEFRGRSREPRDFDHPKEEFFLAQDDDYRGNDFRNVNFNNRRQIVIDAETNSADFDSRPTVSNPRYDFANDDRRKVGSLGHGPSVSHHSLVDMETEEDLASDLWVRDDRFRKFSGKRPRIENFNHASEGSSQEFIRSPQKKVQRTSALLRVQLGKNSSRNWNDNDEYFDDPDDASFTNNRGPIVFSDLRQEEDREFSGTGRPRIFPDRKQGEDREFRDIGRPRGFLDRRQGEDREFIRRGRSHTFSDQRQEEGREFSGRGRSRTFSDQRQEEDREFSGRGRSHTFSDQKQEEERVLSAVRSSIMSSDQVQEQVKEATSVELDVSFKSNALVAKPVVTGSDRISIPNSQKRKGMTPLSSVSSPQVTEIRELQLNAPPKNLVTASTSNKGLTQSKAKVTLSETGTGVVAGSQPCPNGSSVTTPPKKSSQAEAPSVMCDSNKRRTTKITKKKIIKKKIIVPDSGLPRAPVTKAEEGVVDGDSLKKVVGSPLSSVRNSTKLDEKVQITSRGTLDDVCPQPSQKMVDAPLAKRAVAGRETNGMTLPSSFSGTRMNKHVSSASSVGAENADLSSDKGIRQSEGVATVSGCGTKDGLQSLDGVNVLCKNSAAAKSLSNPVVSSAETSTVKKKKVLDRLSGLSCSKEIHERPLKAAKSAHPADLTLLSVKGLRQSKEKVTASGSGTKDDVELQSLDDLVLSHRNSAVVESHPNHTDSSAETPLFKKKTVHDRLSGFISSTEIADRPVNADSYVHCVSSALSSDKDVRQSENKVSVSSNESPLPSPVVRSGESLGVAKKKSVLDRLSGFPTTREIDERTRNMNMSSYGADATLISEEVLGQSEQKAIVSGTQTSDNVESQSFNKMTVSLEERTSVPLPPRPIVCLSGISKNKKKNNKKKVIGPVSGLSSSKISEVPERSVDAKSDNSLLHSGKEDTVSAIGTIDAISLQSLHGVAMSSEANTVVESSLIPEDFFFDTLKERIKATDHVYGVPSARVTEICEQPANNVVSSDDGLKHLEEKVTDSGIPTINDAVLTSLHRVSESLEKHTEAGSVSISAVGSSDMNETNKIEVKGPISGLPSLRPGETHERMLSTDTSTHDLDPPLISDRDLTKSEQKVTEPFIEDSAATQSLFSPSEDSDGTYTKIKKQSFVPIITGSPMTLATKISNEFSKGDTFSYSMDPGTSSEKGQRKSEEKCVVSGIETAGDVCSKPMQWVPTSLENTQVDYSSVVIVSAKDGLDKDGVRSPMHPIVGSISFIEEPTIPDPTPRDLNSSYLLGLEGYCKIDDNSALTVSDSPGYALSEDITAMENGGEREGKTDIDTDGEHSIFHRENWPDCALQMLEESDNTSHLELHNSVLDGKSPGKVIEDDEYDILVKDGLCVEPNLRSTVAEPSLTNYNEEAMVTLPEGHITVDSYQSSFAVREPSIKNTKQSKCHLPSKKDCKDSGLNSLKVGQQTMHDRVILAKKLPLTAAQTGQATPTLKPKAGGVTGRKAFQSLPIPKAVSARSSFASGKGTDTSSHIPRPRTWRRTDNPSHLPQREFSSSTGPSQRQSPKKFGKVPSTSYIRKGNSLVRNCAPIATSPQGSGSLNTSTYQLHILGRDESKGSAECESKLNSVEPQNVLGTNFASSITPPLPCNTKPPNDTTKSSQAIPSSALSDPLLEGGSESSPDLICIGAPENAGPSENQDLAIEKSEIPSIMESGKPKSSKINGITYVKCKSNQLVASCSTGFDRSETSNIQGIHSSVPHDQYYMKKKNQLIRTYPSLGSHSRQAVTVPDDSSNSESQKPPKGNRDLSKRKVDRALVKTRKSSKFSMVWTLHGTQKQNVDMSLLQRWKVFPHLFPWKRKAHWRNCISNLTSVSKRNSFSLISKKLLLSRKRDTVYTRSTGGFSLRKSKVLSIGGTNLKWSKSIENRSKKANEEATLAVAAAERKKREHKGSGCAAASVKNKNRSSRERIFRIGSVRYKMDPSKRTLQRIPDDKPSCDVDVQSGKDLKRSFIPKRLVIGNDEYVRIGNGNQLVRDPKKLVRILASEKVRWSLHTARLRMAKKQQYCQFFTRFGKCNKSSGKCPYIHDPDKIAVCTKFLKGLCSNTNCKLTHKVIPERMEDCSYFLQGLCSNETCPYRHVNVNPNAPVCDGFLRGHCADGDECRKKHTYVCPQFDSTGKCSQGSTCKLHHPKSQNRPRKRKRSKDPDNGRGRYFGSGPVDSSEKGTVAADKLPDEKNEDNIVHEGGFPDYISLDVGEIEVEDDNDQIDTETEFWGTKVSDVQSGELDELNSTRQ